MNVLIGAYTRSGGCACAYDFRTVGGGCFKSGGQPHAPHTFILLVLFPSICIIVMFNIFQFLHSSNTPSTLNIIIIVFSLRDAYYIVM